VPGTQRDRTRRRQGARRVAGPGTTGIALDRRRPNRGRRPASAAAPVRRQGPRVIRLAAAGILATAERARLLPSRLGERPPPQKYLSPLAKKLPPGDNTVKWRALRRELLDRSSFSTATGTRAVSPHATPDRTHD